MIKRYFKTQAEQDKFTDDLLEILSGWDTYHAARHHKRGASLSHVLSELRFKGWKNLKNTWHFQGIVEELGCRVVPALLKDGREYPRCMTIII